MRKFIINETQEKEVAKILREEAYQMPVDKKMNKPYCINPEKVLIVKKFLDNGFKRGTFQKIGNDGLPKNVRIVAMIGNNGEPLKNMYMSQLHDLLIDRFQNMFTDMEERSMFLKRVMDDWFDKKIGVHGTLTVNRLNEISSEEVTAEASVTDLNPTDAQKEAGNYKMGHCRIKGFPISIENPANSYRYFNNPDGSRGSVQMKNHYGYFTNTTGNGKDGDAVDVFIGPDPENFDKVYVVDQNVNGEFDESKVMFGFNSKEEAKQAYLSNYNPDWKGFKKITGVSIEVFRKWLYRKHKQRKPFSDYVAIQKMKLE